MDDDAEITNLFPSPPTHYNNYSKHNLDLLDKLKERIQDGNLDDIDQDKLLEGEDGIPSWPLMSLEPPRADWMLEDGDYTVFGDRWYIKQVIPTLAENGGHQLYPEDPSQDRRPALVGILHSILATYSALTKALLDHPQSLNTEAPPEWTRHIDWINVLAQNMMAAANDLRPVQARANLEGMMLRQLELRKQETVDLHNQCNAIEAKLDALRQNAQSLATASETLAMVNIPTFPNLFPYSLINKDTTKPATSLTNISSADVSDWLNSVILPKDIIE